MNHFEFRPQRRQRLLHQHTRVKQPVSTHIASSSNTGLDIAIEAIILIVRGTTANHLLPLADRKVYITATR